MILNRLNKLRIPGCPLCSPNININININIFRAWCTLHSPVTLLLEGKNCGNTGWLEAVKTSTEQSDGFLWPH